MLKSTGRYSVKVGRRHPDKMHKTSFRTLSMRRVCRLQHQTGTQYSADAESLKIASVTFNQRNLRLSLTLTLTLFCKLLSKHCSYHPVLKMLNNFLTSKNLAFFSVFIVTVAFNFKCFAFLPD